MEWKEASHGFEYLDLELFSITVGWGEGSYFYRYLDIRSKVTYTSMGECKKVAETSAILRLRKALDLLTK